MNWGNIVIVIVAALLSGLLGVVISIHSQRKHEANLVKIQLLLNIFGYRYLLTDNFKGKRERINIYLNQIILVFSNSSNVIIAYKQYRISKTSDDFITLLKAMCDDAGLEYGAYNDSLIDEPIVGT